MAEKNIKTRIQHKHDIAENWSKAENFIPKQAEIIIYDIDEFCSYERFKIGDGVKTVNELPFSDIKLDETLSISGAAADAKIVGESLSTKLDKDDIATDEEIIAMLAQEDVLPAVADVDGSILADENENILLW